MRHLLDRLYKAAAEYYFLKETGEPMGNHTAEEIRDEMFSALLDVRLSPLSISGKWLLDLPPNSSERDDCLCIYVSLDCRFEIVNRN